MKFNVILDSSEQVQWNGEAADVAEAYTMAFQAAAVQHQQGVLKLVAVFDTHGNEWESVGTCHGCGATLFTPGQFLTLEDGSLWCVECCKAAIRE